MRINCKLLLFFTLFFSLLWSPQLLRAQGALNPPGPPGPLFKTLGQIEPRYPISDFQTNLTLPGSYYLTTNLFSGGNANDGINIRTNINNITIDLNGFSIISTNALMLNKSPAGIRVSGATNIVIRNGHITGFDRAIRLETSSGVVVEKLHVQNCTRAGIESDGSAANLDMSVTVRDCIVENIDATGEGASASGDGIAMLNCTAVVQNCVVRNIVATGTSVGHCIVMVSVTNSFVDNNLLSNADFGLGVSGGGTRVYYRNNLTSGCTTPFSSSGGVDRGGNF